MLHPRPSSSDAFHTSAGQGQHQHQRTSSAGRFNGYRGTASPPIAPYAFQSTPSLRFDPKAPSTTVSAVGSTLPPPPAMTRQGHLASSSTSTTSSTTSSGPSDRSTNPSSFDEAAGQNKQRSTAASTISLSTSVPDLSLISFDTTPKPSPDRYRRGRRPDGTSISTSPAVQPPQTTAQSAPEVPTLHHVRPKQSYAAVVAGVPRTASADDMHATRQGGVDLAKRYRRRSLGNLNNMTNGSLQMTPINTPGAEKKSPNVEAQAQAQRAAASPRPDSAHGRNNSSESATSGRPAAARRGSSSSNTATAGAASPKATDAGKRSSNLSPLARSTGTDEPVRPATPQGRAAPSTKPATSSPLAGNNSPAVQQLAALSAQDAKGKKSSRFRRAFSFGGSTELKRAMANNAVANSAAIPAERLGTPVPPADELNDEDQEIARRQEAAGIGAGIYSGQGGFSSSTDNLSISSTASSASIMLRKMGQSMKKGGRSIKGLFRPKSVIGVPAADGPVTQATIGEVSLVTVEAEREKVNVNLHPADQPGGGTGFPKLERNSIDAGVAASADLRSGMMDLSGDSRRSIVGSDRERAEVLTAVRKGILKRAGTSSSNSSPTVGPVDKNPPSLPHLPHVLDSPASSSPSTPVDNRSATPVNADDYFAQRFGSHTKLAPSTPSRMIHFSPRIQFHDAYSASDYDRRGDIATCNRLTPMLAQQIKEELNTFKMEMEVHEMSKPYTHFF